MIPVELELNWKGERFTDVKRGLEAVAEDLEADTSNLRPIVRRILTDYMNGVVTSVRARASTPWPGGTSDEGQKPGTLSKRSGGLLKTLAVSRVNQSSNSSGPIEVSFKLSGKAAIHERGATIVPRNARYLTVPLPPALDSRGVPIRQSARDWKDTFVARSKRGSLLIFQKRGREIVPLYVLVKKVTIPPRLQFGDAFRAGLNQLADEIATQVLRDFQGG